MIAIFDLLENLPFGAVIYQTDLKVIFGNKWMTDELEVDFTQWIGHSVLKQPRIPWWNDLPASIIKRTVKKKGQASFDALEQHQLTNGFQVCSGRVYKGDIQFGILLIGKGSFNLTQAHLESFSSAVLAVDPVSLSIISANRNAGDLYGYRVIDLLKTSVLQLEKKGQPRSLAEASDEATCLLEETGTFFHLGKSLNSLIVNVYKQRGIFENNKAWLLHIFPLEADSSAVQGRQLVIGHPSLAVAFLEIASKLIGLEDENPAPQIEEALEKVTRVAGFDFSGIFLFRENFHHAAPVFSYHLDRNSALKLPSFTTDKFPWWIKAMLERETFFVAAPEDLPVEAHPEKKLLENLRVKSALSVPVYSKEKLVGFVAFFAVHQSIMLFQEDIDLFNKVGKIFYRTIKRFNENKGFKETLKQYQLLANNISDVIFLTTLDLQFLFVTPSIKKLLGYEHQELVGSSLLDLIHDEDMPAIKRHYKISLKGKEIKFLGRFRHKLGSWVWIETNARSVENPQEKGTLQIISVSRSAEERKAYEDQLRSREQRLRSLVESQTSYLIRIDLEGNFTYTNRRFNMKLGKPATDLLYQSFFDFIPSEEHKTFTSAIQIALGYPHKNQLVSFRIVDNAGNRFYTEWEVIAILNEEEIVELQWTGKDITEQVLTKEKLSDNLTLLAQVFEQSTDALFIIDRITHQIVDCNPKAVSIFEADTKEKLIGKKGVDFEVDKRLQEVNTDLLNALIAKGKVMQREARYQTVKGNTFWGNLAATTFNFNGKPVILGRIADITAKKEAEERAVKLVHQMMQLNQQLENQNKELNKTNEALDRFVYSVSHDLRAPINSSLGVIELCMGETEADNIKKLLELQQKSLLRLDKFIHDILDFSRNTRLEVKVGKVDLSEFFEGLFSNYEHVPEWGHIKRKFSLSGNAEFLTDGRRLQVIFNNLLTNSLRYHDPYKDSPFVSIKVENFGDRCVFTVEDNGIGIPNEHLENIFKMFFRANDRTEGSGLGLYIVKESVEKLKGEIKVTSEFGKGATFTLTLPKEKETT